MQLSALLDDLDLNSYEKAAIVFLAGATSAGATAISKGAMIPQGRIYSVLASLHTKGIVEIAPTNPKTYKIDDIKEALNRFLQQRATAIEELKNGLGRLEKTAKRDAALAAPSVTMYSGRDEHLRALISLKDRARKVILQIAPLFISNFAGRASVLKAIRRGVKVKVITRSVTPANRHNIVEVMKAGAEVRTLASPDMISTCIVDSNEFLIGMQDYSRAEERLAIQSINKAVLGVLEKAFWKEWKKARPIRIKA